MLRGIAAIVAGVIAGIVVIMLVESAGHLIFPPPEGVDLKDPEALQSVMNEIPLGAKLAVLIAWGLGVAAGAIVARLIANRGVFPAMAVAAVLFAGAAYTMTVIPHPAWMIVGAVAATLAGAFLAIMATPSKGASASS